ncbi:hypothetical protein HD806DRAFT_355372 [Xylariaceae sp. AK1471]|nr:hypothetical protein HD806DRAFT_355372 [Xylariaceae sp. AK1471]
MTRSHSATPKLGSQPRVTTTAIRSNTSAPTFHSPVGESRLLGLGTEGSQEYYRARRRKKTRREWHHKPLGLVRVLSTREKEHQCPQLNVYFALGSDPDMMKLNQTQKLPDTQSE